MVERSLSMREVPGSMPGASIFLSVSPHFIGVRFLLYVVYFVLQFVGYIISV